MFLWHPLSPDHRFCIWSAFCSLSLSPHLCVVLCVHVVGNPGACETDVCKERITNIDTNILCLHESRRETHSGWPARSPSPQIPDLSPRLLHSFNTESCVRIQQDHLTGREKTNNSMTLWTLGFCFLQFLDLIIPLLCTCLLKLRRVFFSLSIAEKEKN